MDLPLPSDFIGLTKMHMILSSFSNVISHPRTREPRHIVADESRWVEEESCLLSKCEICDVEDCKVRFTKYDANVSALGSAAIAILQNVPAS